MEKKYTLHKHMDGERPPVMWAWTDRVNPEDIVRQIHHFKEAGIEEFYIHPSWTLEVDDYLSETYMSWIKLASDTAESLGMKSYCKKGENHLELRFTTPLHPTFVIEEVELVSQGVMIYHGEAPVQTAGLLSVPVLDVIY